MTSDIQRFFDDKVPKDWFTGPPSIVSDDDEIHFVGVLPPGVGVDTFRERTRPERMTIAQEAESRFGRTVSWGVDREGITTMFTTQSTPVMTRLRLPERAILDTLIDAGVAKSRSDALAWCVRLVGRHQAEWLADLREALIGVEQARAGGPTLI
jgi:hypothetical protein